MTPSEAEAKVSAQALVGAEVTAADGARVKVTAQTGTG